MFITSSAHKAIVKGHEMQIAALRDEIRFLRDLVNPRSHNSFVVTTEANGVLDGRQDQIEIPSEEVLDEISERDRILSGNF